MTRSAPLSRPRILLASSDDVQRATLEAGLLRHGADVRLAGSCGEAKRFLSRERPDAAVISSELSGGALGLCAELPENIPVVMVMGRNAAASDRHNALVAGAHVLLSSPCFSSGLNAAVNEAMASVSEGLSSGDLEDWSVADLIRRAEAKRWTGEIIIARHETLGRMQARDGVIVWAECGDLDAEQAVLAMVGWQAGVFHTLPQVSEASRVGRNVHRSNSDILLDGLAQSVLASRELAVIPGIGLPHRADVERADRLGLKGELVEALTRLLDGRRTLFAAARAAGVETIRGAQQIRSLVDSGVIRPCTGVHVPVIPDVGPPIEDMTPERLEAEIDQAVGIISRGSTVSRRLSLTPLNEPVDTGPDFEEQAVEVNRRRNNQKVGLALASFVVLLVAAITIYTMTKGPASTVEVEVIEDVSAKEIRR
ncbi:MAG: CheY-like chemotaxis protein [Myxococcota bacterium]